jgi:hypothetical protein
MDRTEQRYVMKFLFMEGRKYKAIHTELSRVLEGHVVSVDVCKYWCRKFKAGDFSMDDRVRPGSPPIELSDAIMSLLSGEPLFRLGFSHYDFHRRTRQSHESGEWSRNAKVHETVDTAWFEWSQSKRTSHQSKFTSGRAPSWWREWIREHNGWWRELIFS